MILAAAQNDVKRLLAYSSIENIGIVLIGLGIAALGKSSGNQLAAICGLSGALPTRSTTRCSNRCSSSEDPATYFPNAHHLARRAGRAGGTGQSRACCFWPGTTAICALPPLNGFVSELLIYLACSTASLRADDSSLRRPDWPHWR